MYKNIFKKNHERRPISISLQPNYAFALYFGSLNKLNTHIGINQIPAEFLSGEDVSATLPFGSDLMSLASSLMHLVSFVLNAMFSLFRLNGFINNDENFRLVEDVVAHWGNVGSLDFGARNGTSISFSSLMGASNWGCFDFNRFLK